MERFGRIEEPSQVIRGAYASNTVEQPTVGILRRRRDVDVNMPFVLAWPGVTSEESSSWSEDGESWRRLEINFPDSIATHCSGQTVYFDKEGFLKRHDYDVEIAGNTPGAHYMDAYVEVSAIKFPTVHRIFARGPDRRVNRDPLWSRSTFRTSS